ncbi:MAG: general secretion pathway protein D [Osedax symbiont Rs2]|nr:MAG: general secretion pathway protein D [Osedax symbiont Rs2]
MKLNRRLVFSLVLLSFSSVIFSATNSDTITKNPQGQYTLDMRGVQIREFINTISKMIGKTIITDSKVRGKVDIQSPVGLTKDELYEVFLVQLGLSGFSVVDTRSGILKVIPSQGAKLEGTGIQNAADALNSEQIVTRIVQVKNVNANQLAATLRPLIDPRLGIIAAYETSNVILVTDRSSNVRRIAQIIDKVDRADSQTLELIPLYNASAGELERILKNLTLQPNGKQGVGTGFIITADQRTNMLIVKSDDNTREKIRRIVNQLDSEVQTNSNTKVIYLKYAKAKEVVQVLKGISDTIIKEETQTQGSTTSTRSSNINIDIHEPTNTVVMSGSPHIIKTLESVITQLDIRRAQVLVEAIIAEVSEDKAKELGVQWLLANKNRQLSSVNFRSGSSAGIVDLYAAGKSGGILPSMIGNGATLGLGKINVNGFSFAAFINALESDSDSNVLSTPSLVTLDNEEASIQVGQEVPIITGSTASSSNANPFRTIVRKDIGIKLKVTPQINEGDAIQLTIEQEISSISQDARASDIITNKRIINTTVLIDDGGTITLGGLINDDIVDTTSKVPLLGDIPLLGKLFSSTTSTRKKRTLMIFIRPTIIRSQQVATDLSRQKYNFLRAQQVLLNSNNHGLYENSKTALQEWQQRTAVVDLRSSEAKLQESAQQLPPAPAAHDIVIIERSFQTPKPAQRAP